MANGLYRSSSKGYSVYDDDDDDGGYMPTKKAKKIAKYCRNMHPPLLKKYGFPTWIGGAIPYHHPTTTII